MENRRHGVRLLVGLAAWWTTAALLAGCKSPAMQIQGGGFRNMTDYPVRNVTLRVTGTGREVSCSYISPQGFFGTRIPLKEYEENPVEVSWNYQGTDYRSGPFLVPVPDPIPDEPVVFVVRIHGAGQTSAAFIPLSEIPPRYTR